MTPRPAKPSLPPLDRGWEVEWCSHIPRVKDDEGNDTEEADLDGASIHACDFLTLTVARAFAKKVFPEDQFGCVRITQFEMLPYEPGSRAKYREYIGPSEDYEGEETP